MSAKVVPPSCLNLNIGLSFSLVSSVSASNINDTSSDDLICSWASGVMVFIPMLLVTYSEPVMVVSLSNIGTKLFSTEIKLPYELPFATL